MNKWRRLSKSSLMITQFAICGKGKSNKKRQVRFFKRCLENASQIETHFDKIRLTVRRIKNRVSAGGGASQVRGNVAVMRPRRAKMLSMAQHFWRLPPTPTTPPSDTIQGPPRPNGARRFTLALTWSGSAEYPPRGASATPRTDGRVSWAFSSPAGAVPAR